MDLLNAFNEWFWNPSVWLMPGVSWEDMKSTSENSYPNSTELLPCAFGFAFFFLVFRYCFLEPFIMKPLGHLLGLKEHNYKRPPSNKDLERLFLCQQKGKILQKQVLRTAQSIGWTEREVERWLHYRKKAEKPSTMFKFCDCSWQLFYCVGFFAYGIFVVQDKEWFWDIKFCWSNYPFQAVTNDLWWYYMIPLGYYTYMSLTFMIQPKRKDSLQMFLHHIVTIALIVLSFTVNMVRAGSLILFVHECADIPLLIGKICRYAGYNYLMDFMFVIFIFFWVATRLFLFPFWIMKNTFIDAPIILDTMYPIYYIFNGMLCMLLTFHLFWTYLIIQIMVRKVKTKHVTDVRSESELSEDLGEISQPFLLKTLPKKDN